MNTERPTKEALEKILKKSAKESFLVA